MGHQVFCPFDDQTSSFEHGRVLSNSVVVEFG
jgi:hypothetical protein